MTALMANCFANKTQNTAKVRRDSSSHHRSKTAAEWFNVDAFARPAFWALWERWKRYHYRGEADQLRHGFFQCCEHTYGDGAFGQVAGTADPWVIQFALRWSS